MASLTSQRLGNSISWTLQYGTRSRSIAFSFSTYERNRCHRRHHHSRSSHTAHRPLVPTWAQDHGSAARSFSTQSTLYQTNPSPGASNTAQAKPAQTSTSRPHGNTTGGQPLFSSTTTPNPAARPQQTTGPREPPPSTQRTDTSKTTSSEPIRDVTRSGLFDGPVPLNGDTTKPPVPGTDWTTSFSGLSSEAFSKEVSDILLQPLNPDDIEVKPDGIVFLPEIKYRRILNRAFGPGGWGLAPRGETIVTAKAVTREYALVVSGRLISLARGEQDYFDPDGIPTATEGCKSNALMRCCKDLGIASELWDPRFIRRFMKERSRETWVEHVVSKKRRKIWMRKDDEARYPYKEVKVGASGVV
ncbi:MAG: hypothetical protein M1831_007400 [Alyxoria varia]|nr:MAG: hypothetical protein M1831_007400 [Alyxoria varia]